MSSGTEVAKGLGLGNFRQVGIVVKNMDKTREYYEKTLGLQHFDVIAGEYVTDKGKAKLKLGMANLGGIQFELIEPLEGKTIHTEFLKQGREGLHHLGFYIRDLDRKVKELQEKGVRVLEPGKILGVQVAYMDTAGISGVIFELIKMA